MNAIAPRVLPVDVVPMKRRHLPSVMRIESTVYPRPWSAGLFLSELAQRDQRAYFVAKHNGKVVGYAGLMILADEGHVTTIAVDPELQRGRIGTRLMLALMDAAVANDCRAATLEVRRANTGAQDMYRRFGFATVGVRKGYYVETGEDAFVMWAEGIWTKDYRSNLDSIRAEMGEAPRYAK